MRIRFSLFLLLAIYLVIWSIQLTTRKDTENISKRTFTSNVINMTAKTNVVIQLVSEAKTPHGDVTENERCDRLQGLTDKQAFQSVDSGNQSFVYSALWDNVNKAKKIRIVGMSLERKDFPRWYCYIRDQETQSCIRVNATMLDYPFPKRDQITGRLFLCDLPSNIIPEGVSLRTTDRGPLYNTLPILKDVGRQKQLYNFTMCVPPFHSVYNDIRQLITYIELNKILGADYFVFYNTSMSRLVEQLVLSMMEEGSATIVQWQLPEGLLEYYGQVTMINDCMNRMIYRTRFIVVTDLDEFFIPRKHAKWHDLISEKERAFPQAGVFLAKTEFYLSESANSSFEFPGRDIAEKHNVLPLLNLERRTDIPRNIRMNKYIYNPRKVENPWVHWVIKFRKPWRPVHFQFDEAVLHHYRDNFKKEYKFTALKTLITDTTMFRFKDELLNRVKYRASKYITEG